LGSDQAVRRFFRYLAGSEVNCRASLFLISWKGFSMECGEG
jgi:hypothetical protein